MFDKKDVYVNEIQPLIIKIREICSNEKLPMFFAVAVADNGEKTTYEYETIHAVAEKKLSDDHIASSLLVINGFDLDYPDSVKEAIMVLEKYTDRISEVEETGIELSEDNIALLNEVNYGAKAVLPKNLRNSFNEEDFE